MIAAGPGGAAWPVVLAATRVEARAVRRVLPDARLVLAGVRLSRLRGPLPGQVVLCGVAGSVRSDVPTGTVLVPERVLTPSGRVLECDAGLVAALVAGARALGLEPDLRPLVTLPGLVTGGERRAWAARGCAGADMETGLVEGVPVATVRVVLDTPDRELSPAWGRPWTALWQPRAWTELPWLAREAPRCAHLAATVLRAALQGGKTRGPR